ncbi:hypothetical protein [Planococcus dechangensis]|uniref:RsgI N-terminal anti-sigma domain-containing protein n=1 Tax=Planococcus dechangensis TaxID=1176255 RepID=A0ABV9MBR4_9BACL
MRMQKGICIELDGDRSVYMLADGRFVTGRPQEGTVVGEEAFFESLSSTTMKRRRARIFTMPIIATVAIVMLIFSTFMMPEQEAYGYVQVESNPGIELALNDERQVISLRELNADGRRLIEQLDKWENGTLEDVLKNVLALSISDDTEQVTITTVQEQGDTKTISTVEQITLAALTDNADKTLHIHLKEANKKQWRLAKEQQVPVGQFAKNNKTYSSPAFEDNKVQPARNEDEDIEKADGDGESGQADKTEQENPDVESKDAQPGNPSSAKPFNETKDTNDLQPVPVEKPKPAAPKENNSNKHESKPQAPATKKDDAQPAKPSPEQPKKPNAGTGSNSAPKKTETVPSKKESPAEHKSSGGQKAPQSNKDNKQKDQQQDKPQDRPKDKQSNSGNNDTKGKNTSEENKTKNQQNNAPPKSGQLDDGKGEQNKNGSSSIPSDGKADTPYPGKKTGKDDVQ